MNKNTRIFVTGNRDTVGNPFVWRMQAGGYGNLLLRTRSDSNLLDHRAVQYRQMIGDQIDGRSQTMRVPFSGQ